MKFLKTFEGFSNVSIFEEDWRKFVPNSLVLIKGDITDLNGYLLDTKTLESTNKLCQYKLANIMSDPVYQITYERDFDVMGIPDTIEFDVTILNDSEISFEITFGDMIACGFNIKSPNVISVYEYTSFDSLSDPTDTVFAFDEETLNQIVKFINHFENFGVKRSDLNFLDNNRFNYKAK